FVACKNEGLEIEEVRGGPIRPACLLLSRDGIRVSTIFPFGAAFGAFPLFFSSTAAIDEAEGLIIFNFYFATVSSLIQRCCFAGVFLSSFPVSVVGGTWVTLFRISPIASLDLHPRAVSGFWFMVMLSAIRLWRRDWVGGWFMKSPGGTKLFLMTDSAAGEAQLR
ncbi:unnamed protein product, partial [Linum tenue]